MAAEHAAALRHSRGYVRRCSDRMSTLTGGVHRKTVFVLLLILLATAAFAAVVVKDLKNPLLGLLDINQWLYQGYYFATHIHFNPLPDLDLHNNDVFYPYGVSNVFRPWNFEAAYAYAIGYWSFGHGPWLQWYYVVSVGSCAVMTYFTVRYEFGHQWATLAAFALSFCNFYAIGRFPGHFGYAVVHWLTLSVLLDFIIVRRFVFRKPVTAGLLLLKALAQVLCFGHDLAYVCGIALTSMLIAVSWVVLLGLFWCRWSRGRWVDLGRELWSEVKTSALRHKWMNAGLGVALVFATCLYLPLVWQVYVEAKHNGSGSLPGLSFPVARWRFFLPILPNLFCSPVPRPGHVVGQIFTVRPGLFFVGGGLLGFLTACFHKKRWLAVAPFALLTLLILTMDLKCVQFVRVLPWLENARAPTRYTLVLPVLLFCMLMQARPSIRRSDLGKIAICLGTCLILVETATAYYRFYLYSNKGVFVVDADFQNFMNVVAESPGEAVMEWPFDARGANRIGRRKLDVYWPRLTPSMAAQAFHHKKMMGSYFGRLHPEQIEPLLDAGWQWLFLPNDPRPVFSRRQHRDFTAEEWMFVEDFFRLNDFCGVIVYADLLPPETVREFHKRFGAPAASVSIEPSGELQFIRKPAKWRGDVNVDAGRQLAFRPPLLTTGGQHGVSFCGNEGDGLLKSGWSYAEPTGRWSQGTSAELAFSFSFVDRPKRRLVLDLELHAFRGQPFKVFLNDQHIRSEEWPPDRMAHFRLDVPGRLLRESNLLRIETPRAAGFKAKGAGDRRKLGIHLKSLSNFPQ